MKHAAPAPKRAWHVGRPTMPSIGSAIASDGMLSDTDRWRWALRLPFPTSFANSPKRTCDRHQYIDAKLEKADRPAHRVVAKNRFARLDTIDDVIRKLVEV